MKKINDVDLKDILLNPQLNNRGQYVCDCPFCGKEHHFYISKETQLWDCKKCGEFGSVYKLLKQLNKTYLLAGSTIEIKETIDSVRSLLEKELENDEIEMNDLPVIAMPAGWKVLKKSKYLQDRGVTYKDILQYHIGSTNLFRKFKNYILIPVYDNKQIKGFVGRYADKKVPDNKLRYNNSKGTKFSELLFGYDEITEKTLTVILVEGIFDKISVDKFLHLQKDEEIKCVCTFGKKISKEQSKKLRLKGVTNIVLLYDFDAIKSIKRYGLELEKYFLTSITYTMKKDIDECSESEALEVFTNLQKPEDFNVNVIGKLK